MEEYSAKDLELLRLGLEFYGSLARQHPESEKLRFANAKAINRYGRIEFSLGHHDKAEQDFLRALEQLKKIPSSTVDANHLSIEVGLSHRWLGGLYLLQNQNEKALLHAQMAVAADSDSFKAFYNYGTLATRYAQMGQYENALDARNRLLKLAPDRSSSIKRRALLYFQLGNYKMALADIANAVQLNPDDTSNLLWISLEDVANCPDKSFRDGILKLADKTIELTNGSASAYIARSRLLQAFGRHEQAVADYEKIIQLDPNNALTHNNAAWNIVKYTGMETEWIQRAVALAQKAVELEPNSGMYRNTLGVVQYRAEAARLLGIPTEANRPGDGNQKTINI